MNLPNALTLSRIFFVPVLLAVLLRKDSVEVDAGWVTFTREWLALLIFLTAALTDLLDGYLARRRRQVTTLGKLLDPIADKLLISAAFISLVELDRVPAWMVVLIVSREFAVSALRYVALTEGIVIAADAWPGASWPCTIEELAVEVIELETRRVGEVSCTVENADGRLLPNLTIGARIETGAAAGALSVPRGAVGRERGETFVWVAAGGKASRKPVALGVEGADFVEIASGLTEADTVLLPGAAALTEGRPVLLQERAGNE